MAARGCNFTYTKPDLAVNISFIGVESDYSGFYHGEEELYHYFLAKIEPILAENPE